MSYRGLPYLEVRSQTFRNNCKIWRSQPQNSISIVHWPQWPQSRNFFLEKTFFKKALVLRNAKLSSCLGLFTQPVINPFLEIDFFSILSWNYLKFFFRFFAIFAPYPAIYPVCIRPMTLDRENSWLKPLAGWPLKTGFENLNSGAGGTVLDLPMCPCTSWCSIGHMWHRHQNCKRSLNNILYIFILLHSYLI